MHWEDHSRDIPKGKHAMFGGSNYQWTTLDTSSDEALEEALRTRYYNKFAKDVGTIMHAWAADRILYKANVVKSDSKSLMIYILNYYRDIIKDYIPRVVVQYYVDRCFPNLMTYIKDAIGYRMDPEVDLKYSDDFYGTADAISFKDGTLRIHDLKTGTTPASLRQLEIYAAFCCLEYDIDPTSIFIELRIYQNEEILVGNPPGETIKALKDQIKKTSMIFEKIKKEG